MTGPVVIRGAGDIATGIAVRLARCGYRVVLTERAEPLSVRRMVCFSEAVREGTWTVEGVTARLAPTAEAALALAAQGEAAVLVDPEMRALPALRPAALVDAILAKRNIGTALADAPLVIACGPGFVAGVDCHAVVETLRGHDLGRVITAGAAAPNTGVPGPVAGVGAERVLRAPAEGLFRPCRAIGDRVRKGDLVAEVAGAPVIAAIDGVLRGLLAPGTAVTAGLKAGDIDPRGERAACFTVSDKARAVAGGVLEALLCAPNGAPTVRPE